MADVKVAPRRKGIKRKPRNHPLDEGSLQEIMDFFVEPLIKHKPAQLDLLRWLEEIVFLTDERVIQSFKVVRPFKMPGLFRIIPSKPIQGFGPRSVFAGSVIWVRRDVTTPYYDVEAFIGQGKKEVVFMLDEDEWSYVVRHLEPIPKKKFRRRRRKKVITCLRQSISKRNAR